MLRSASRESYGEKGRGQWEPPACRPLLIHLLYALRRTAEGVHVVRLFSLNRAAQPWKDGKVVDGLRVNY